MVVALLVTITYFVLVMTGLHNRTLTTRNAVQCLAFYAIVSVVCYGPHYGPFYGQLFGNTTKCALLLIGIQALLMKVLGWEPIVPQWKGRFPWR